MLSKERHQTATGPVLLAEGDWNAINETLYLISIPGMRETIIEAMKEPLQGTSTELEW